MTTRVVQNFTLAVPLPLSYHLDDNGRLLAYDQWRTMLRRCGGNQVAWQPSITEVWYGWGQRCLVITGRAERMVPG